MIGSGDIENYLLENGEFDVHAGIIPRAITELFRLLHEKSSQCSFEVI